MKIIYLKGGLGNQMFQYAYGRNLELAGENIIFNVSFFSNGKARIDTDRDFKLTKFNIGTKAKFLDKRHSLLDFLSRALIHFGLKESGFYQSEKYFKNIESDIRWEFTLKNHLAKESLAWQEKIKGTENSISLHIRRGDYVQDKKTNAFHGTCDIEYYKKALAEVVKRIGERSIEIFIFSDDIEWAKKNLSFPYSLNFVSDLQIPDYEEMYLMSLCKNNIIANSSFSWWGAWLNNNSDKIVVAPKQWFANKTSDEIGILPKTWLQI